MARRDQHGETAPPADYPGGSTPVGPVQAEAASESYEQILGDLGSFHQGAPSANGPLATYYAESDVFLPFTLSTEGRYQLQRALYAAGWLSEVSRPGQWDADSQDAFRELLTYANHAGTDWRQVLQESFDAQQAGTGLDQLGTGSGGGAGGLGPLTIQLPNEDDVRRNIEQAARDLIDVDLGEDFWAAKTAEYMDRYRDIQLRQSEALRSAQMAQEGGTVEMTQPPSIDTFIEEELEEERPGLLRRARVGDAEDVLVETFTRSYG